MAGAVFDCAAQLAEADDRDIEFAGQPFQVTRDFRNFLDPVFGLAAAHQLQIVNDEHFDAVLGVETPGFRAQFLDRDTGRVVNVEWGSSQTAEGPADFIPRGFVNVAGAEAV